MPQSEREYDDLLTARLRTLADIKRVQGEIAGMGFFPADAAKHNALLAERLAIIGRLKQLNSEMARAPAPLKQAMELRDAARERLKTTRDQQEATRALARIEGAARAADLRERFGSVGGRLAQAAGSGAANAAWGAAQKGAAFVRSQANRGFQGTVELARLQAETEMLAREFAGVMKPMMDLMTTITRKARKGMEGLSENQQDWIQRAVIGVVVGGIALRYRRPLAAGGRFLGRNAGVAGSVAGMAAIGATDRRAIQSVEEGETSTGIVQGASKIARFAVRRIPIVGQVIGAGTVLAGYGETAGKKTNPYTQTFREQNPDMAARMDGKSRAQLAQEWQDTREAGKPNRINAGGDNLAMWLKNTGRWIANQVPVGSRIKYEDEYSGYDQFKRELQRKKIIDGEGKTLVGGAGGGAAEAAGEPTKPRRMVTLQGGGIQEAGAGYFAIQERYARQTAEDERAKEEGAAGEDEEDEGRTLAKESVSLLAEIAKNTANPPQVK